MEEVLDLYHELHDPRRPVVCFDESNMEMHKEVCDPLHARPGAIARYDSLTNEMERATLRNERTAHRVETRQDNKVTAERKFFQQIQSLVDDHYLDAISIRV